MLSLFCPDAKTCDRVLLSRRLTVGLSKSGLSRRRLEDVACRLRAKLKQHVQVADIARHLREPSTSGLSQ